MDTSSPGTGYIPSPFDYRDRIAAAGAAAIVKPITLQPAFDVSLPPGPVLMQGKIPACVAHSITLLLQMYWMRKTGKVFNFSPRFLDILVKRFDGLGSPADRAVQGTYPQLMLKLACMYGCATIDALPNATNLDTLAYRDDSLLTPSVMAQASAFRIPGYIRIPDDFYAMRAAVQTYGPISIGQYIGEEWWTPSWAKVDIDPVRTPKAIVSGHQTVMRGWRGPIYNRGRNSWSDAWCDRGDYDFDGAAWAPYMHEAWAIAEVPVDVVAFLKLLPSAENFHYTWKRELKRGFVDPDVGFAQVAYMILGYLPPILPSEFQHFGPKTAAANLLFQQANHISPTAPDYIGPETCIALNRRFAL